MSNPTPQPAAQDRDDLVRWVRTWQQAGAELRGLRDDRLRRMTEAQMRHEIQAIFCDGPTVTRSSSGLVEMQRILAQLA